MRLPASISNRRALAALAVFAFAPLTGLRAGSALETMDAEVSSLYEKSKDAIVKVHAESDSIFGAPARAGTGFFIDHEGRLVTSAALVENTLTCWIDWQGQRHNARLLGVDPNTNLAMLQADTGQPTPTLTVGNSDELRVGSMVVTIGFPYELPSAPAVGFVTGLDIKCGTRVFPVSYIRAGCRLRPGQGGAPMFNSRGEAVGVAVAAHGEDQCYALPISAVNKVAADIRDHGQPQHAYVGLSVTEHAGRVFVQEVTSNSPAAVAGFQDGDTLLRICTNEIRHSADVLNTMFYRRCGDSIKMSLLRDGVTQEVTVIVGKKPTPEPMPIRTMPVIVPASAETPR
jgi:serine protease Do